MLSFFKEIRIYLGIIFLLIGSLIALMYFSLPKGLEEFSLSLPADEEIKYERETIKLGQQDGNGVIKTDNKKVYKQIKVKSQDNLIKILRNENIPDRFIQALVRAKGSERMARIKEGDFVEIVHDFLMNPASISVTSNFMDGYEAIFKNGLFKISKFSRILDKEEIYHSATIEDSLFMSGKKSNIPESIIMDLAYIFGWDIDFIYDIRSGDSFELIYEQLYWKGNKVRNGDIISANFYRGENKFSAVRYFQDGKKDYFSQEGNNLKKAFLGSPVEFSYVSSKYNLNRKHPILNTIRAHTGVDYAATTGTPVRATGEGTVIFRANKGGYGRLIEIRHFNEYTTRYAHLSGYAKGLQVGSKVDQGDIIGYVGKSGLATGPHLHYEFRVNGMHTDPLRVKFPNAKPIESENKEDFTNFALALDLKMNTLKKKLFSSNEEKIEE